jgi:hypothetical protein
MNSLETEHRHKLQIHLRSRRGEPTRCSPPTWGLCRGPKTSRHKKNIVTKYEQLKRDESHFTTDVQLASLSWHKAPIWGLQPDHYYCLTVKVLFFVGALSDERSGLSFVYAAGLCQRTCHG